jgi:hypothetical protein
MDKPVELIPLVCPKCSTRLPAKPGEYAWVCPNCQEAAMLDEKVGLEPLVVYYQAGILSNQIGRPFWVTEGRVLVERKTYSGNQENEALTFWSEPKRFFVPAYIMPLENLLEIGIKYLKNSPKLQGGPAVPFMPVNLPRKDVRAVAEFIVMAVEADRKDKLKEIKLTLTLSEPTLWVLG